MLIMGCVSIYSTNHTSYTFNSYCHGALYANLLSWDQSRQCMCNLWKFVDIFAKQKGTLYCHLNKFLFSEDPRNTAKRKKNKKVQLMLRKSVYLVINW